MKFATTSVYRGRGNNAIETWPTEWPPHRQRCTAHHVSSSEPKPMPNPKPKPQPKPKCKCKTQMQRDTERKEEKTEILYATLTLHKHPMMETASRSNPQPKALLASPTYCISSCSVLPFPTGVAATGNHAQRVRVRKKKGGI